MRLAAMRTQEILDHIPPGQVLIVHASFKSCKEEGLQPVQVIKQLCARLGPEGTLLMPTFSYNYSGIWKVQPYDAATTPGCENGILSETFRKMPGVLRSNNPTYSVAVWGKYAQELTEGSCDATGLGHGSSYENACKLGAWILLLNVGNNRNSMLHYAEIASGVPYNDIPFRACWGKTALTLDGEMPLIPEFPACSEAFSKFDEPFVRAGFARKLGNSYLIHSTKMVDYICGQIRQQPDIMLCSELVCEPCTLRRRRLQERELIK